MQQLSTIVHRSIQKIKAQGSLPDSPCLVGDETGRLCAAANVVYCAVEVLRSKKEAQRYAGLLLRTGDKQLVRDTARELRLPLHSLVEPSFVLNDRTPHYQRVDVVVEGLQRFLRTGYVN